MNENDILFQKVTQAYSEKIFFPSMPVSLSGIIYHSYLPLVANSVDKPNIQ